MTMARRSTIGRAMQTYAASGATGPRALVVAIIGYAARDALDGDVAAARFLLSPGYRRYLELAGLPPDWLPAGVTRADLAELVEAAAARVGLATSSGRRAGQAAAMSQNVA